MTTLSIAIYDEDLTKEPMMRFHPDAIYTQLYPHFQERIRANEPLSRHGALGIGGRADLWISLDSTHELETLVSFCAEQHVPLLVIGNGTNMLFAEKGMRGIVARMAARSYTIEEQADGTALLLADAGVSWPRLIHELVPLGWGNLEFGAGIPGTLGGSIVTNAGTHNTDLGQYLQWIDVLDARGCNLEDDEEFAVPLVLRYSQSELDLEYRHSRFRQQRCASFDHDGQLVAAPRHLIEPAEIVLRLALTLHREQPAQLYKRMQTYEISQQRLVEPGKLHAGPIFKDPPEGKAAELIAQAGMSGFNVGRATVSTKNANFIINESNASNTDIVTLITTIHQQVLTRLDIDLSPDIELQG
ncbi:MAG: UDP-N-acetylmuramate dehydrogenase [Chloroflexi bacterium]|nr:MAG: UDP-N-acetylmuramate dehydrogenase [Chloroflexota bacterium]